ncbi:MAG: phospho-N-acetylmuramoyl-pentapeptide-transferase [Saprospiraceae bacterium]
MLYHLFDNLNKYYDIPGARLFQYITFRAGFAMVLSLMIAVGLGDRIIKYLRKLQIGETVRDLGLEGQKEKEGTPTMGGIIMILAILIPTLLLANLNNVYIQLMIVVTIWMGLIGFLDDYIKVFRKNKQGLKSIFKIFGQVSLGLIVGLTMLNSDQVVVRMDPTEASRNHYRVVQQILAEDIHHRGQSKEMVYVKSTLTNVPFLKGNRFDYARISEWFGDNAGKFTALIFILAVIFIVTAVSNGSNLTDGIDGLAGGSAAIIGGVLGVLAYVSGNSVIADYLDIFYLPFTGEMVVFIASFLGACIGFLWYNAYPARVFMGDTGSLMIGGVIAALAIILRKELLLPGLCGIFFVETISVMMQVSWFKYTKRRFGAGRRIFLMSPLHHHFQKLGIHESKIVTRFWIVGIFLAVSTIITLKIR